ncbi:MAG TPA: GNAT family N-acetyltransferase [Burkholderiaceae bacterium]|jgi:hypothetical protein
MPIRPATPTDFPQILALNAESVQFLSPLDLERLQLLDSQSAYHRVVVENDGTIAAFLLAFREGSAYDSPNYRWFAGRYEQFLYIDRVVVSAVQHGRGIGKQFYADLIAFARDSGVRQITCEFDLDPPNETSRRFHAALGFQEVGTQVYGPSRKQVSLQALKLG